jgi:hypothetical protein
VFEEVCGVQCEKVYGATVGKKIESHVKFGSIDSHSPMRGHMGHPEASQGDLENQPVL